MTSGALPLLLPVLVLLTVCGCGSCQRADEPAPANDQPPKVERPAPAVLSAPTAASEVPNPSADLLEDCFVFVDAEPDYGDAPLATHFTTELECGDRSVTYSWDFGDGSTAGNEQNPSHVYAKVGDYVATVTVTTQDGGTGSDEIDIFVEEPSGD